MAKQPTPVPPTGYIYHGHLFQDIHDSFEQTKWWLLIRANLLALVPLGVGVVLLWIPYHVYLALGTPLALFPDPAWPTALLILGGALIIGGSMVLHELLHGAALCLTGHRPHFFIRVGVPHTGIRPDDYLPRNHFLLVTLTPLVVMTLFGSVGLLFLPRTLGLILLTALLLNIAASIADLLAADRLRRWPANTLFADNQGIRVFIPAAEENSL